MGPAETSWADVSGGEHTAELGTAALCRARGRADGHAREAGDTRIRWRASRRAIWLPESPAATIFAAAGCEDGGEDSGEAAASRQARVGEEVEGATAEAPVCADLGGELQKSPHSFAYFRIGLSQC